jgi:hypothetical protein
MIMFLITMTVNSSILYSIETIHGKLGVYILNADSGFVLKYVVRGC